MKHEAAPLHVCGIEHDAGKDIKTFVEERDIYLTDTVT